MLRWTVLHLTVIEEQLLSWDQKEESQVHTAGALDSVYFTGFFFQPISLGSVPVQGNQDLEVNPGRVVQTEIQDTTSVFSIKIPHGPIKIFISFWLFIRCLI